MSGTVQQAVSTRHSGSARDFTAGDADDAPDGDDMSQTGSNVTDYAEAEEQMKLVRKPIREAVPKFDGKYDLSLIHI